ncbi:MAG TPA: glycosyltransferase [Flavobacteriales bacterium]|nr:glycosyltransferase [Flavobacteriales bacterium]
MKVGFVTLNTGTIKGGSEKLWRQLACEAQTLGHEVAISVFNHQLIDTRNIVTQNGKVAGFQFFTRKTFTGKSIIAKIIGRIEELTIGRFIISFFNKDIEPDVCIISCGGLAELGLKGNQKKVLHLKVPYSIIIQNNLDEWDFSLESKIAISRIFDGAVKNYFVSKKTLDQSEHQIGTMIKNSSLIANPIPTSPISPIPSSTRVQLAFIGTLDLQVKGVGLLVEALSKPFWEGKDIVVNIYGEGKDKNQISSLIREFGVDDTVFLRGWVDDMEEVWSKNHALVSTSFNEGLPMVIQEAMMRGRVVIATDVGGATEIVTDGETGFIAKTPTVVEVQAALESWWLSRDRWSEMGAEGARAIREFHDNIPQPMTVLKELLSSND